MLESGMDDVDDLSCERNSVRLAARIWIAYLLLWLIAGAVAGGCLYGKFPLLIYFVVPFVAFAVIGVVPATFGLLWMRLEDWKQRGALAAIYAIALIGAFEAGPVYRARHEAPRDQGPYLSWAGDPATTMTVSWTTAALAAGQLTYAKAGQSNIMTAEDAHATHYHHVALRGLAPDTEYAYAVADLGKGHHTFRTAPVEPESFSFLVYGDTRPWGGLTRHRAVVGAMLRSDREAPCSFVFNTGDIVENPGAGYGWQWYLFLKQIVPLAATRPYMISLGNHEARKTTAPYERYFDFGTDKHWYSFDYAGVHLVSLSTQHDTAPGSEQHAWLAADLEAHAASSRYVVVFFHKPMVTYDPRESYHNDELREHLMPLFDRHSVDIAFCGHVHAYEHHALEQFEHVVTGGGGVLLWATPAFGTLTVATETVHHFCRVDVSKGTMRVRAMREDASIIDDFEVRRKRRADSAPGRG